MKVEADMLGLQDLQIVLTPGLNRGGLSEDFIAQQLSNCVMMSLPGPHAFLVFVRIGHSDYQDVGRQMDAIKEVFGTEFINHTMVVFTGADVLKQDGRNIEDFVERLEGDFKEFMKECKNRYVAFDNQIIWGSDKKKPSLQDRLDNVKQSRDLIDSVMKMVDENDRSLYSDDLYKAAGQIAEDCKSADDKERMEMVMASTEMESVRGKVRRLGAKSNNSCVIL